MNEENYFKNLTDRERAIFEGGISMGALFHQFVGTPVSINTVESLEKAIVDSILLQPAIIDVCVYSSICFVISKKVEGKIIAVKLLSTKTTI